MTRIDSSFVQVSLCDLFGLSVFCTLKFTVVAYDWESDTRTDVYSDKLEGQATGGLIKDNVLYVGNFQTANLLVTSL